MTPPLSIALVTPLGYQPFHSIRQLCGLISTTLSSAQVQVTTVTPPGPLGQLTLGTPAHSGVAAFERLTLSPMLLRARLLQLQRQALRTKQSFAVVLSDQSLGLLAGALRGLPTLVFVSDLISLRASLGQFQQPSSFGRRFIQQANLSGLHTCQHFITPSASTAADLQQFLPSSSGRITIAPLPLTYPFAPIPVSDLAARQNALWRTLGLLPPSYLLHIGSDAWYKNRLGFLHLGAALRPLTPTPPALVFAGAPPSPQQAAFALQQGLSLHSFPHLSPADLQTLICGAQAVILPSYLEGFGWPALEALACGTALVITDTSALSEHFAAHAAGILPVPAPSQLPAWAAAHASQLLDILSSPPAPVPTLGHLFSVDTFRSRLLQGLQSVS